MSALYLGLISGTSADGIDAALVQFDPELKLLAAATRKYPAQLRERLLALTAAQAAISLDELGALDVAVGECFAEAAVELLAHEGIKAGAVTAIGSHGQTIRHRAMGRHPFSLQIGDAAVIAETTGICTVADFRRADIAAGGQGAPLAPAFHASAFASRAPCAVLNLGGIANVSLISGTQPVLGFDTGPASCLMDAWIGRHRGLAFDLDGTWARSGTVHSDLLNTLLEDPYFSAPAPKSSGREYFNLDWLDARLGKSPILPADTQATLLALTVRSIVDALQTSVGEMGELLVCGGGVHNPALMADLSAALAPLPVRSTSTAGIDPDFVEAALFAWLARERLAERPGNLPSVSGARGPRVLGAIHSAPR
ncbi:anhydro-N-acetylmuramic acid kinase [Dokdonella immobilis]|uniref:Anhydro-N-acetylmuramic acid kinase n=1 Tax=Dokdonella immobilis TaxID=578942 RepID=A0A1I5AND5_9GAMM|nr:anhydro-N-acetylmuramic acid kinase [Dokdonella immobilis]SFN63963.1 anhydro-N-acetylmuramic acid kinase [Dokdonella immobilis]